MLEHTHAVCILCEEPITDTDELGDFNTTVHRECAIRSVLGPVAHAQKRCSCFIPGSMEGDPEGMSKRNAARAAVEAHRLANFGNVLNVDGACPSCGCKEFNAGPTAGRLIQTSLGSDHARTFPLSRNIRCTDCGAKYWYSPPFQPVHVFNGDEVYNLSVRHTLPFPEDL